MGNVVIETELDRLMLTQGQSPELGHGRESLSMAWVLMTVGLLAFWLVVGATLARAVGVA